MELTLNGQTRTTPPELHDFAIALWNNSTPTEPNATPEQQTPEVPVIVDPLPQIPEVVKPTTPSIPTPYGVEQYQADSNRTIVRGGGIDRARFVTIAISGQAHKTATWSDRSETAGNENRPLDLYATFDNVKPGEYAFAFIIDGVTFNADGPLTLNKTETLPLRFSAEGLPQEQAVPPKNGITSVESNPNDFTNEQQ